MYRGKSHQQALPPCWHTAKLSRNQLALFYVFCIIAIMRYAFIATILLLLGCQTATVDDVNQPESVANRPSSPSNGQTAPAEVKEIEAASRPDASAAVTYEPELNQPSEADTAPPEATEPSEPDHEIERKDQPEASEPTNPAPATTTAASPHALAVLRAEADAKKPRPAAVRTLIAALIASGKADLIDEAETRLDKIDGTEGFGAAWLRLQRAGIAEAIGDFTELEAHTKEAWREALKLLPMETGRCFIADDVEVNTARDSISFRPEDYVIVAFELRYFGVTGEEKGYKYNIEVSAKLLDEDGNKVKGFLPPKAGYGPGQKFGSHIDHPAERWVWFEYQLKQFLPRDLKAGNYIVEITINDLGGKGELGDSVQRLDIRVR